MEGRKLLKDRKTETATITNNGARHLPLAVICVNKRTRQMSASEASQATHNVSLLSVSVCVRVCDLTLPPAHSIIKMWPMGRGHALRACLGSFSSDPELWPTTYSHSPEPHINSTLPSAILLPLPLYLPNEPNSNKLQVHSKCKFYEALQEVFPFWGSSQPEVCRTCT